MSESSVHTIGALGQRYSVPPWKIRRLFERGLLPPAQRVGAYRVVATADLPKVEAALREAGYLPAPVEACATSASPDAQAAGA